MIKNTLLIFGTVGLIAIALIAFVCYCSYRFNRQESTRKKERTVTQGSYYDSTDSDYEAFRETKDNQSQQPESEFKEERYSYDSTDSDGEAFREAEDIQSQQPESKYEEEKSSYDSTDSDDEADDAFRQKVSREMDNSFRDLVFDRLLAHLVGQVDHLTFLVRLCETTNSILTCYLRPELYSNLNRPVVGGQVRLEYNYVSRVFDIIELVSKTKEKPPWAWNTVFAEIIGQFGEEEETIFYAELEPGQVVPCKVRDYLRDACIQDGDIVYLEVNERTKSYYILEIVEPSDY